MGEGSPNQTQAPIPPQPSSSTLPAATHDLDLALKDAEKLLAYVAAAGIEVEPEVAQRIIAASRTPNTAWDAPDAGALVEAITKLAAKASPVTAETLRCSSEVAAKEISKYALIALAILVVIVTLSFLSFVTSGLSQSINADVQTANGLAVTLHAGFDVATPAPKGTPVGLRAVAAPVSRLEDLQQFATTVRSIKQDAVQLNTFLFMGRVTVPTDVEKAQYELPAGLVYTIDTLQKQTTDFTSTYQGVRRFAKDVQNSIALQYGAIGSVLLPMLYALLGACAYLLRLFSAELNKRTFSSSYAVSARFFIALIGGLIVGLFNNFTVTGGASLSPLALAFLVGYAADVFFSFLEGLLQNFKKAT
jgi:hypothetical protein